MTSEPSPQPAAPYPAAKTEAGSSKKEAAAIKRYPILLSIEVAKI
jgi:hypothetical protein